MLKTKYKIDDILVWESPILNDMVVFKVKDIINVGIQEKNHYILEVLVMPRTEVLKDAATTKISPNNIIRYSIAEIDEYLQTRSLTDLERTLWT